MTHPLLPLIRKKICDKTLCIFIKRNKLNMSSAKMQVQTPASKRLSRQFYDVDGEDLAKALLGQNIVRMVNGTRLCARIVETEAYLGGMDKAAHSYKGQTDRNKAMFMEPGTAYVYTIYGMHYCFNISSQGAGCAVLIRSVEPLEGVEKMGELRKQKKKSSTAGPSSSSSSHKVHQLANGPAKLCQAMAISKQQLNQRDLVTDTEMWLEEGEAINSDHVVVSARINIAYAEEWTDKPLRFYLLHNRCVSVRDKAAEKQLEASGALGAAAPNTAAQKQKGISKMDAAKSDKPGKRKVKASSVDDDKVGTAGRAKTARKERGTTSQYFSTT